MADLKLPSRSEDFSEWYNQLVLRAELAIYAPVRGCMIVRPYGWALWENITAQLDRRFKATGHVNAAFPLLIPQSFISKEQSHVAGFRPSWPCYARRRRKTGRAVGHPPDFGDDHRPRLREMDSVVPRSAGADQSVEQRGAVGTAHEAFLRTLEFYWQEGHTAHATYEEAEAETRLMLDIYTDFAMNEAAVPVIPGRKSSSERFAGADATYSIEAMMGDGKALQAGTSHNLGQNFAKAFEIRYLDQAGALQHCWTTSWGLSTRFIGAIIMVHGDDQGLILPPRLAPHQVVIVPIFKTDEEKALVFEAAKKIREQLVKAEIRVKVDEREGQSPGFKFNDWEMRGVPLRMEIGPKDVAKGSVVLARRDRPGKEGKNFVSRTVLPGRCSNC